MQKNKKIRLKSKEQRSSELHNSLDSYLTNLKEASIITRVPDSNTVVLHLPKEVKEIVFIDRKQLDLFLGNISKLVFKMAEVARTFANLTFEREEDE